MEYKTAWKKYSAADLEALEALNAGYKTFLDNGKTERECVDEAVKMAEAAGYIPLETALKARRRLGAGDKIYAVCMNKALALFQLPVWTSSRTPCMKTRARPIWIPITTAASRSISGLPSPWPSTALW